MNDICSFASLAGYWHTGTAVYNPACVHDATREFVREYGAVVKWQPRHASEAMLPWSPQIMKTANFAAAATLLSETPCCRAIEAVENCDMHMQPSRPIAPAVVVQRPPSMQVTGSSVRGAGECSKPQKLQMLRMTRAGFNATSSEHARHLQVADSMATSGVPKCETASKAALHLYCH